MRHAFGVSEQRWEKRDETRGFKHVSPCQAAGPSLSTDTSQLEMRATRLGFENSQTQAQQGPRSQCGEETEADSRDHRLWETD